VKCFCIWIGGFRAIHYSRVDLKHGDQNMKKFTRTINGIKYKGKLFEREDLIEKLGRTEDEWSLVEKYQKNFIQLLINDTKDFVIDGEQLCNELGVLSNFTDWLLRPNKGKEGKLIKYRCKEGEDYVINLASEKSERKNHGGNNKKVITLTLECAKKIAMRQNNEYGDIVCDYFILMEKILKEYESWMQVREPEKSSYLIMDKAINEWGIRNEIPNLDRYLQKRECNLINMCLVGYKASDIQDILNCKDRITRDHFKKEYNLAITNLQEINTLLLDSDMLFSEREKYIQKLCNNRYSHIKEDFKSYIDNK
jgi:phage anti-repressor protein